MDFMKIRILIFSLGQNNTGNTIERDDVSLLNIAMVQGKK